MSINDLHMYAPIAFVLVFALFMCYFRTSYYENTTTQILFCVVFSAMIGAGAAVVVSSTIDFFRGTFYPIEPKLDLMLYGALGGAASRLLNTIIRRLNGLSLMNIKDIVEMREQMSATERMIHAVECPFHKEHARLHARNQGAGHETSRELSGGCFIGNPMVQPRQDRFSQERESAVDNRPENCQ